MFDHIVAADSALWPLLVLVSIWFFAFIGGYLGTVSGQAPASPPRPLCRRCGRVPEGPGDPDDSVPVLRGAELIVERPR